MGWPAALVVGLAFALDALFAEPPSRVHPVALFGRLVAPLDRAWPAPKLVGTAIATLLPLAAAAVAFASIAALETELLAATVAGCWLFSVTSRSMLVGLASDVVEAIDTDSPRAREQIRGLVGRDTTTLGAAELRSGAVESAAENVADGLVAPLLAFAVGAQVSLALGVAAAVWVKAVNTLDSMLGYPSKPHGWASARLDDAVMWVPARLSAVLLALAARNLRALAAARRWARTPPSPNSGWPMATLAVATNTRLHKPEAYTLNPDAPLPSAETANHGIRLVSVACTLAFLLAGVAVWF
ncbi:adenosylcobinamide-phosphate synthase CbiB [Haladaptatus sp. DYSN1]|uniref:adenosylcobinamide-phosphate synthase CbiB n=1 Tax=unclassified Haladaptatus TaxID=2622732 RepID=UPI00240688E0|nr:adenosylcobinamide-phosphate synthase CbiB [Haladaptatus sp. DYSN1]